MSQVGRRIGLVMAMRAEVPPWFVRRATESIATCQIGKATVGLIVSGIGLRRARMATQRLCQEFQPSCVLSLGVCGGVADGIAVGDLIVADRTVRHQQYIAPDGEWIVRAAEIASQGGLVVHVGTLQTVDRVAVSRRGISATALGVDMECYAVAQVAGEHGLPALVVRAISDIVPQRVGLGALWHWLLHMPRGFAIARMQLHRFAELFFRALSA